MRKSHVFRRKFRGTSPELQELSQKQLTFLENLQIPGILMVQRAGRQQNENDPLPLGLSATVLITYEEVHQQQERRGSC